jgi:uncharacterized protein YdeI (BOF family)
MKTSLLAGLAVLLLGGTCVLKGDENPNNARDHVSSVAWVIARDKDDDIGVDDRYIVLIGKISEKYKDETYFFNDGTGTIQLDSEARLPVGKDIVVRGRIDQAYLGIGKLEIDVQSWRYVK